MTPEIESHRYIYALMPRSLGHAQVLILYTEGLLFDSRLSLVTHISFCIFDYKRELYIKSCYKLRNLLTTTHV
jgi:hypothetical protein